LSRGMVWQVNLPTGGSPPPPGGAPRLVGRVAVAAAQPHDQRGTLRRRGEHVPFGAVSDPDAALPLMILLVRHGATEWSINGRHTGRSDLPLVADGVAQAERVGELIGRILA